jgi:hypothetical protein
MSPTIVMVVDVLLGQPLGDIGAGEDGRTLRQLVLHHDHGQVLLDVDGDERSALLLHRGRCRTLGTGSPRGRRRLRTSLSRVR